MSDHGPKDEAIRRAAQSTQPEVALVIDGYCIIKTTTLAQHEYNFGELSQLRHAAANRPDYLREGVGCCSGCFCNHDPAEIAQWEETFRKHDEMAAQIKAEQDARAAEVEADRVFGLHEHVRRFRP